MSFVLSHFSIVFLFKLPLLPLILLSTSTKTLKNSPTFIIKHFSKLGQCWYLRGINLICFRMSVGTRQYGYSYSQSQASYLPRVGYILRGALLLAQTRLVRSGQTNTQDTKLVKNLEKLWNITVPFLYWGHQLCCEQTCKHQIFWGFLF